MDAHPSKPMRAARECTYPGCHVLVRGTSRCDQHKPPPWKDRQRGSYERGYDHAWRMARNGYIQRHPVCEIRHFCEGDPGEEVDHVIPLAQGGARLDEANMQTACKRCHRWKTQQEKRQ